MIQDMVTQLFHKATRGIKNTEGGSANKLHNTSVRGVTFCEMLYNEVTFQFTLHFNFGLQLSGTTSYFGQFQVSTMHHYQSLLLAD
jgi:hypothetical protein